MSESNPERARALAEAEADAWIQARHPGASGAVIRNWENLPYCFAVEITPDSSALVLVHGGAVVEETGLGAMAGYLEAIDFQGRQVVTAEDLLVLLEVYDAWPELGEGYPPRDRPFVSGGVIASLDPSLVYAGGATTLTLHYEAATTLPEGLHISSPLSPPARRFLKWTVTLTPGAAPSQATEVITYR